MIVCRYWRGRFRPGEKLCSALPRGAQAAAAGGGASSFRSFVRECGKVWRRASSRGPKLHDDHTDPAPKSAKLIPPSFLSLSLSSQASRTARLACLACLPFGAASELSKMLSISVPCFSVHLHIGAAAPAGRLRAISGRWIQWPRRCPASAEARRSAQGGGARFNFGAPTKRYTRPRNCGLGGAGLKLGGAPLASCLI